MIIQPKTRGFICTTAHPLGCAEYVQEGINYIRQKGLIQNGPKKVLVIGASSGYGLASRLVAAFGCGSETIGVFFEKEAEEKKTATAGWYNTVAFEEKAKKEGLYTKSFNADAFSNETKESVAQTIQKDLGKVDLVIYSLASPRRTNPHTGRVAKSVLKPIGKDFKSKSINLEKGQFEIVTFSAATEEEIHQTITVMGGEDWELWIDCLKKYGVLAQGVKTVAYSYIGPEITRPIYRDGTIGKAKEHLEATAKKLDECLKKMGGRALVSVNKAIVTQSSSAIPFVPLYLILLMKIMKEKGLEEGPVEQVYRLFTSRLFAGRQIPVDQQGLIRMDDWEMRPDVQEEVRNYWMRLDEQNLDGLLDLKGYQEEFLKLFGFGFQKTDYSADVNPFIPIPSIQ